jgi:hypothetical protein
MMVQLPAIADAPILTYAYLMPIKGDGTMCADVEILWLTIRYYLIYFIDLIVRSRMDAM